MKIKVCDKKYSDVSIIPPQKNVLPEKQRAFWRWLLKTVSAGELKKAGFTYSLEGMDDIPDDVPCLFLMNHSSFIDLEMAAVILQNRQYHIICTDDGFVGKEMLMRKIGCIPTKKFITDISLVRNMKYCTETLKSSILIYPEASYSFDGTATPLPESLGKCLKLLKVPVVMIRTKGAFLYDPLYNCLQKRNVKVSAKVKCILTPEDIEKLSVAELNAVLAENFCYDHFKEQYADGVKVSESFRADRLERALYKCPHCLSEEGMKGSGIKIRCESCGREYTLEEDGRLSCPQGAKFEFVSDWYAWERECVRNEAESGEYRLETDVDIIMLADLKSVYRVGEGHLSHNSEGFHLKGCGGELDFSMPVSQSYSLYADYYWYEIGDMICIGDSRARYYCFPKGKVNVAKARLAAEELFKLRRAKK